MHLSLRYPSCGFVILAHLWLAFPSFAADPPTHLVAVMPKHFPPLYSVSRNNVPTGYGVEFMELVAEQAELDIAYQSAVSWPEVFQMIDEGRADIIPNLGITQRRMKDYAFSKPYDEFNLSIFVKYPLQGIDSLSDLKGKRVGVVERNRGQSLLEPMADIGLVVYSSLGQLVAALRTGEVDAAVYPAVIFENFTTRLGITETFEKVGQPLETVKRAIAVRKGLEGLIPRLNRGVDAALNSPKYAKIYERWHPEPPAYWNTRRVWMLIGSLVAGFIAIALTYRYVMTRKFNKELIRYSNLNQAILNATSDGIVTIDSDYRIIAMNACAETLFNEPQSALRHQPISQLIPGKEFRYLFEQIVSNDPGGDGNGSLLKNFSIETLAVRSDNQYFPVRIGLARMDVDDGTNVVCTVHDESRMHEAENRAVQLINHDPLTGVMNRRGMIDKWSSDMPRRESLIYCFCVGLNHMAQINSLYGRQVGDDVLVQVANILTRDFPKDKGYLICRSSGSHFIMTATNPDCTLEQTAQSIIRSINSLQVEKFNSTSPLIIDPALGAAVFPDHAKTIYELIDHAEIAYVTAKRKEIDNFIQYTGDLKSDNFELDTAYQRVKNALTEDRITLYYQPIQTIKSKKIHHYEALVRMHDEDGTLIMPDDIIPVSEKFNMMAQVDYKVIKLALKQLSLLKENNPEVGVSVNLSAKHIGDARLYDLITSEIFRYRIDCANLTFEITETAALQNFSEAREFMSDLIQYGCRFALDDFGVGFTSFAQLRMLPVDIIKIDGMFIRDLHKNKQDEVFVKAMTDVAHSLGKKVVAEYVENEKIFNSLERIGVDFAQGFHVGRPHPDVILKAESNKKAIG